MKTPAQLNFWPSFVDVVLLLLCVMLFVLIILSQKEFLSEDIKSNQHEMVQAVFKELGADLGSCPRGQRECYIDFDRDGRGDIFIINEAEGDQIYRFSELILFDSGRANLKEGGKAVLEKIGRAWAQNHALYSELRVDGHTDNWPIQTEDFTSNWHLGAARAVEVANFIENQCEIDPYKGLTARSFSEYRPAAVSIQQKWTSSDTVATYNQQPEDRAKNRRVEVILRISGESHANQMLEGSTRKPSRYSGD
ncbi:MAG: OmpA family protein [Proteobacteria bacterium]|nr:OmpA family protein [Pseudomonadota bacterium]